MVYLPHLGEVIFYYPQISVAQSGEREGLVCQSAARAAGTEKHHG